MSRIVEVTFDCGYRVEYPVPSMELSQQNLKTYELSADLKHDRECTKCTKEDEWSTGD